jgi:hypothetical protein
MCDATDKDVFVNWDNFFNFQAAACASKCKTQLIARSEPAIMICTEDCDAYVKYRPGCETCMQKFLICQSDKCASCFVSGTPYLAKTCKDCAARNCRTDLQFCTGFSSDILLVPTTSPTLDTATQQEQTKATTDMGVIIGGSLGGIFAALGAVALIRRRQMEKRINGQLKEEMEDKIFKNKMMSISKDGTISVDNPAGTQAVVGAAVVGDESIRVNLRTRYSFHGDPYEHELDVPAGATLTGIQKNEHWWIALDSNNTVGMIPVTYVSEV